MPETVIEKQVAPATLLRRIVASGRLAIAVVRKLVGVNIVPCKRPMFWSRVRSLLLVIWVSPWTLVGLIAGGAAVATGGRMVRVGRVLEFHGGILGSLLRCVPIAGGAAAMTLGHCVIARSQIDLDRSRDHERVHVAQYERWGPLFVPAYFAASLWAWLHGQDPYLSNPFEVEAYGASPRDPQQCE